MTQINRKTAIALAKEAGMAGMLTDVVCSLEEIHRLCNLAVAHSRKDAEPVDIKAAMKKAFNLGQTYWQQADSEYVSQQNKSDATKAKFDALLEETLINATHPPEADKLLQQALEVVLDEHLPGFTEDAPRQHDDVIYDKAIEDAADAIQQLIARTYLEGK